MRKPDKPIPKFRSEAAERAFWEKHDSSDYLDWSAARAVALTLDLARAATSVTVLSGGKGKPHGATAEELLDYYALRGITAEILRFDARNPGAALLDRTVEVGASLLVMGAYGHSHERETLFGGNTQAVVDGARIPVVMVH